MAQDDSSAHDPEASDPMRAQEQPLHQLETLLAERDAELAVLRAGGVLKAELLATVSHELRSPLAMVKGYAATLRKYDSRLTRQERTAFLDDITPACDRLEGVIARLLELSRLESGLVTLQRSTVDLVELAHEAVAAIHATLSADVASCLTFTILVEGKHVAARPGELAVWADPGRLREVLDALLDNACKYSPQGGAVGIVIRPADDTETLAVPAVRPRAMLELCVRDTGLGIPLEHVDSVFERFHRVDTRLSREEQGLGIGLTLGKHIIALHGGRMWVESALGAGSAFHVLLPRGSRSRGGVSMVAKKTTILVADDELKLLRLVTRNLELEGYATLAATDGQEALELIETHDPDLLLLDVMMPKLDGFSVTQRVREFSSVPIIIMTARGDDRDKIRGLDLGGDDYLTKPFNVDELLARVRAVLRRSQLSAHAASSFAAATTIGDLRVDFAQHQVWLHDEDINLRPVEYRLLAYLAQNAGRVLTQDQLLEYVWRPDYVGETHMLQVNINRVRRKIEPDPANSRYILTKVGIGYLLSAHPQG
jgi:DNA-binding response OmpR family regulator/signal transduction histidine kinase